MLKLNFLKNLFSRKKTLDRALLEEIETTLLLADTGVEVTQGLIDQLTQKLERRELADAEAAQAVLKHAITEILLPVEKPLVMPENMKPYVILMVGVNGAGKTTTIGKLAHYYQKENKKILFAAGDTFRAAAIEQLQQWGKRLNIPIIAQHAGADAAAVIYDALQAAKARGTDLLIADTAGRLHTQSHLMTELQKIKKVLGKIDTSAPHEVLLVLDATAGQNAKQQVKQFAAAMGITGLIITKLDGTAKAGSLIAIAQACGLPIRFVGVGEGMADLKPFSATEFVDTLFKDI
jgi:fused signal recognition particle receptor